MNSLLKYTSAFMFCAALSAGTAASLIGDEITVAWQTPQVGQNGFVGGPFTFVVTADDSDKQTFLGPLTVDVGAESFQIDYTQSFSVSTADFNGLNFTDLDWVGQQGSITNVSYEVLSGSLNGLGINWTADSVQVNFAQLSEPRLGPFSLRVDLETTHASVPEPGVVGLVLLGLAGLGVSRRVALGC